MFKKFILHELPIPGGKPVAEAGPRIATAKSEKVKEVRCILNFENARTTEFRCPTRHYKTQFLSKNKFKSVNENKTSKNVTSREILKSHEIPKNTKHVGHERPARPRKSEASSITGPKIGQHENPKIDAKAKTITAPATAPISCSISRL